ncbi:leucine--tRNA ligase [Candidatus Uhrbacteria bacterium]|nr:leucine--tRNA ligase [Candidatus Uhrbacteria bacterium]
MSPSPYTHRDIEKKWQQYWQKNRTFEVTEDADKKKYYCLDMFPYPSSNGLHVGHPEGYTATDIFSRFLRMHGYNVLHPMGWDAFGLPAENYAIKKGIHPRETTEKNIENFRAQIRALGFSYDWSREINTSLPEYYRWTQWLFLELYKHGLAYKKKAPVNWCESCKTVLANEQVQDGSCERCGDAVIQKELAQWFFRVTKYAEELLSDLAFLDWPAPIKRAQQNWIGRSEGAILQFPLVASAARTHRYVLLHGFDGSPDGIFFPWLTNELSKRGLSYQAPVLPHSSRPTEKEQVDYVLRHCTFDEHTVLFGHSLGAAVALKVAENLDTKIAKLVLAGGFIEPDFLDKKRPFADTFTWEFDFEKIKLRAEEILILSEENDYAIPAEQGRTLHALLGGAHITAIGQQPHFMSEREPAILEALCPVASVFTTRPDTLYGATYLVLAPEHALIETFRSSIANIEEIEAYQKQATKKSERERARLEKEKTGVEIKGIKAINPATKEEIPIWIADYVIASYGTGAIMAVPAHDSRDFAFAEKYHLPIRVVVCPQQPAPSCEALDQAYEGNGRLVESGPYTGSATEEAKSAITDSVGGIPKLQYKLRDWLISRQRYWGSPIPIIYCESCGEVAVPEADLPVLLPDDVDFRPTGESPLTRSGVFHAVACPKCGKASKRESDTMDTFVCSSWYFLRYASPTASDVPFTETSIAYWLPVDMYVGGAEHAVLHLLYARFITKALRELGYLTFNEPFQRLRNQGLILGEDGEKMSKSRGNVVNPDEIISVYGADTMRLYEMFMGPFEDAKPWSSASIIGIRRFLERVWRYYTESEPNSNAQSPDGTFLTVIAKTTKKVTEDIQAFRFNTAISALMICMNEMAESKRDGLNTSKAARNTFLLLLSPFAPHIAEELWSRTGHTESLAHHPWPDYDPALIQEDTVRFTVQINGKMRDHLMLPRDADEQHIIESALKRDAVKKWIGGKPISRTVVVPGALINFVIK